MARKFQVGETVICYLEIKKSAVYYNPVTSIKVAIYDPDGAEDVAATDMSREDTGKYSYNYQTASKSAGSYRARFTATDGVKITSRDSGFDLES